MSDDLTISVGGASSVVVDELRAAARLLDEFVGEVVALRLRLAALDDLRSRWWYHGRGAPPDVIDAENEIGEARIALHVAEVHARGIGWALGTAADGYVFAEGVVRASMGFFADEFGAFLGAAAPALAAVVVRTPLLAAWVPTLTAGAATAVSTVSPADLNRLASNPLVVAGVRLGLRGADDAAMARLGVPGPVRQLVGDHGLGLVGPPAVAAGIGGLARPAGLLRDGEVRVAESTPLPPAEPVAGFEDRVARIPDPAELEGAQTVIERYDFPDGRRVFEVYIAGTVDFSPVATDEPWDLASNVVNASAPGSGSYEAVVASLRAAGVGADDAVLFTGHSQGGAIAARVAASGEFTTVGIVSFGGPTGTIPIPDDVPAVIVEHTDDLVVAFGADQRNDHAVVVQRYATEDADFENAPPLPAHRLDAYRETARLMDLEQNETMSEADARIRSVTDGAVLVERVAYRCERVEPTPTSSSTGAAGSR